MSESIGLDKVKLGSGKTLLSADVRLLGCVTLLGARLMESNDESSGSWLALPQRKFTNDDGETKYAHIIKLSEPCQKGVLKAMREEYGRQCGPTPKAANAEQGDPFADE